MKEHVVIRDAEPRDYDAILALNEADVEVLSPLDTETLSRMAQCAHLFLVATVSDEVAGFILVMREGSGYWSDNYRWFEERYEQFLYIDRIVIGENYRGLGIGRRFYERVIAEAREEGVPHVTAEVDVEPIYNDPSMRFHAAMGFTEVGRKPYGQNLIVSLQKLDVQ